MTIDADRHPDLTERQKRTLALIVQSYIKTNHPISSKSLVEKLDVSSATIRNDMSALEAAGLIESPHTSAGRRPTEDGYRYFVRELLDKSQLNQMEQRTIAHQFHQSPAEVDEWMRLAAAVLTQATQNPSLVTAPYSRVNRFKHLELIATQGRLVLMVLVMHNGDVRQRMLTLAEPVGQEQLSEAAARLSHRCLSLTAAQIRERKHEWDLTTLEEDVQNLVIDLLDEAEKPPFVYRDGLAQLLDNFEESEGAEQALRVLEEQTILENLITEANPGVGSIRVLIAGEGRWDEINLLSIVLGRYGIDGQATGTLGVLGPTRMRYGRAISAVRYVADMMSRLMIGYYSLADGNQDE